MDINRNKSSCKEKFLAMEPLLRDIAIKETEAIIKQYSPTGGPEDEKNVILSRSVFDSIILLALVGLEEVDP